ncbi:glutathione synthetase ATP-binding domain-like protein [Hypoxylon sp. FL1857]|nr:glutathione synthetase ATP-binding domain-like protein [Hypoxylon sp. FL1857]
MAMAFPCKLVLGEQAEESVHAYWTVNASSTRRNCRTLDLVLNKKLNLDPEACSSVGADPGSASILVDSTSSWSEFVISNLHSLKRSGAEHNVIAIKYILPDHLGFCARSDFLHIRLVGCDTVVSHRSFLKPRQEIAQTVLPDGDQIHASLLPGILANAAGALVVRDVDALDATEAELDNRLSFPWITPSRPPFKRLAYVRGRYNLDHSSRIWEAAHGLGVAIVVIDSDGHWLQKPEWAHLREDFIPLNVEADEGLADRLVDAVRSYGKPIHAINTVSNKRLVAVARACERLGLPTESSEAYRIAADKFKQRQIEPPSEVTALRVENLQDLEERLSLDDQHPPLQYPLVVKPCVGWGSECVAKVHTKEELLHAVQKASDRHRTSTVGRSDVMIETYIEGPEIDANLILMDGEIIFFECSDDFPSMADRSHNKWEDSFQETAMVLPTALPQNEIDEIRTSLHQTVLRQGFRNGVFNCEGRIRNSKMAYTIRNGVEDLLEVEQSEEGRKKPSFYLHEINARPPGYYGNVASNITYGVDYYCLDLLFAVQDWERIRALAQPFKRAPQWWLVITIIPEEKEGIMKTSDAGKGFLQKNEDLNAAVADYMTWKKGGSKLQGPKAPQLGFVAYFSATSRKSREEAMKFSRRILREFEYELE